MASVGNLSLAAVILGPIAWRKYSIWRLQKARSAQSPSTPTQKRPLLSIPSPFFLPSNILISMAYIALVCMHLSYLFNPLKILSRSDLFLLTNTSVTAPLVQIRSKVASMSFEELGWKAEWGDEGLETLLRRLGSFDGRKLHLMIGTSPFLSCLYCTVPKDYLIYSISDSLWQFSTNLLLFGLLTARFDSLDTFDEVFYSLFQLATGKDLRPQIVNPSLSTAAGSNVMLVRPDGYSYRIPLLYLLSAFAVAQAIVYQGFIDLSFGQGRWDHWHSNYNIAFHTTLLLSAQVIYFGRRVPKVPAIVEIANLIKRSRHYTDQTLAHVQASHLTSEILWGDEGLRDRVSRWHDEKSPSLNKMTSDEAIDRISAQADKVVDTRQQRQSSALAAKAIWASSQPSVEEWERILSQSTIPQTPLASSLSQ